MLSVFYDPEGKQIGSLQGRLPLAVLGMDDLTGYRVDYVLTADDVRAEASRRMQAVFGARDAAHLEIIIANANREAIRLLRKGADRWTPDEAKRAAGLEGADQIVETIRAASNRIEHDVPPDYADDRHWL